MRQAALQCLRSTKLKPLWLQNITKTTTNPYGPYPSITRQLHARHFRTNKVSPIEEFTVRRSEPELLRPAKPTPRELKPLSNIDDHALIRCMVPFVHFYRHDPSMEGKDPAKVVRDALAKALVFYYPIAGRLTEGPDGKLSVDCTGEGVLFVEADADVELAQLGDPPRPPFPWLGQFLRDLPLSQGILNSPLFLIQVTRLKCGGFIFAFHYNHIISDASGLAQFLTAVGEIAQGKNAPSVLPIWRRELLCAPNPQPPICTNRGEEMEQPTTLFAFDNPDVIECSFFFGPSKLLAIRRLVPDRVLPYSTTFEILTAFLWRCRTTALQLDPEDTTCLTFAVNARDKTNHTIPVGYYGNAGTLARTKTSAGQLCENPIEYALGLVKEAKEQGVKECRSWRTNPPAVIADQLYYSLENWFSVSDTRRLGFNDVDFGWGKAAYAGVGKLEFDPFAAYVPFKNHNGEDGILVHTSLEGKAMKIFESEVNRLLSHD